MLEQTAVHAWLHEPTDFNDVVRWEHHDKSTPIEYVVRLNSDVATSFNLIVVRSWVLHVVTYANNPSRFAKLYTIC